MAVVHIKFIFVAPLRPTMSDIPILKLVLDLLGFHVRCYRKMKYIQFSGTIVFSCKVGKTGSWCEQEWRVEVGYASKEANVGEQLQSIYCVCSSMYCSRKTNCWRLLY